MLKVGDCILHKNTKIVAFITNIRKLGPIHNTYYSLKIVKLSKIDMKIGSELVLSESHINKSWNYCKTSTILYGQNKG